MRLAGANVKMEPAGVESCRGTVLNIAMQKMQRGTLRRLVVGVLFVAVLGGLHYMSVHDKPVGRGLGCFMSQLEDAPTGYTKQELRDMGYAAIEIDGRVFLDICVF